jgi:hypothetical protein
MAGCTQETESVDVGRLELKDGLGALAHSIPAETSQGFVGIVEQVVVMSLYAFANHD